MKQYFTVALKPAKSSTVTTFIAALIGIILSAIVMIEKLNLALNPNYVTTCSFNPIISCKNVMESAQAAVFFGVPNPIWGLIGFSVLAAVSFLTLFVPVPRWILLIQVVGSIAALIFCFWLATQALFVIQAICLYCCGVWLTVSVLTWVNVKNVFVQTNNKMETVIPYIKIGFIVTIIVFVFMVFTAFQAYWLSLLGL